MRSRFEFAFHRLAHAGDGPDAHLAMLGSQGWEIRGIAADGLGGGTLVALQRPLDEQTPLPDHASLAATLDEPLAAPTERELAAALHHPENGAGELDPV